MDYKEAIRRIEEHQRVHHMQEQPRSQKISEALSLALDVLKLVSEHKSVSEMSINELASELRSRDEVVAVQIWVNEDIAEALRERLEIEEPSNDIIDEIAMRAQDGLENCEHGWDVVYSAIEYYLMEEAKSKVGGT